MTTNTIDEKDKLTERVETIYFQFLDLLAQQARDREFVLKEKEQLASLIGLLISQTKEVGKYEEGIRKRIQDTITQSVNSATKNIEEIVTTHANNALDQGISKLDSIVKDLNISHDRIKSSKLTLNWQTISIGILSGVLSSLILMALSLQKPTLPLTAQQVNFLHNGQMLAQIWPKLTKQEKERIKKFAQEVN